jgi:membrane-bound ClpP family serine protease
MTLTAILVLIVLGVLLILVEFLILPGTNVAGVIGLLLMIGGIYFSYRDIGAPTSHIVLGGSLLFMIGAIALALRSGTWQKVSLNTSIDGKVVNIVENTIKIGDSGETVTRLAPMGKVRVSDLVVEAKSSHHFLDPHTKVVVVGVSGNQIEVMPIDEV